DVVRIGPIVRSKYVLRCGSFVVHEPSATPRATQSAAASDAGRNAMRSRIVLQSSQRNKSLVAYEPARVVLRDALERRLRRFVLERAERVDRGDPHVLV